MSVSGIEQFTIKFQKMWGVVDSTTKVLSITI
jgi:hypothetical protein